MEALLAALSLEGEEVVRKTVVLVGVTGDGKSSTGNSLCGLLAFKTSGGLQSETQAPTFSDYRRAGTFWRVIDTIGLEDTGLPRTEVLRRFGLFSDYARGARVHTYGGKCSGGGLCLCPLFGSTKESNAQDRRN